MSKCYASTIVLHCKQEKGYHEKESNSQLDDKTANSGNKNYNKYADFIDKNFPTFYNGKKNGCEWCDCYVDCMMIQSYGYEDALRLTCQPEKSCGAGVKYSRDYYAKAGRLSIAPIIGAQVFFQKNGKPSHTGIVIDMTDDKILVSAGNTNNAVAETWYTKSDSYILDYGIPDYDEEPSSKKTLTVNVEKGKYDEVVLKLI